MQRAMDREWIYGSLDVGSLVERDTYGGCSSLPSLFPNTFKFKTSRQSSQSQHTVSFPVMVLNGVVARNHTIKESTYLVNPDIRTYCTANDVHINFEVDRRNKVSKIGRTCAQERRFVGLDSQLWLLQSTLSLERRDGSTLVAQTCNLQLPCVHLSMSHHHCAESC